MQHNTDGSLLVVVNDAGGSGIFNAEGKLRVDTVDAGPGLYAADGAIRAEISDDEATPASGTGLYTESGGWRMTSGGSDLYGEYGLYAEDGSYRVTVPV